MLSKRGLSVSAGRRGGAAGRVDARTGVIQTVAGDHHTAMQMYIAKTEAGSLKVVEKLNRWVAQTIREAVTDSQSPLETLESKVGNCQSHARLYTALARAAGIPTRFVSGLVYMPDQGFLYHSWAESFVGEWLAVDPTFGQLPADATHPLSSRRATPVSTR